MCKKCNPNPCGCNSKNICQRDIPSDNVVYASNVDVACLGIQPGTPLTEALQAIGDAYCDLQTEITGASAVLVNIGGDEGVYAGDTLAGAKELKTLVGSDSINVASTSTNINFSVDEDWINSKITAQTDQTIVSFNTANPNTGSPVFTPNLPQDDDVIYTSSVNNSLWTWNGSAYVTYVPGSTTPFYLAGTTNDAGGNKTAAITRTGAVAINVGTPLQALHVGGTIRQTGVTNNIVKTNVSGDFIAAVAGTDYLTPTGSAAGLTSFPILNQNTTGNAATVTTIPTLSGDVTNVGNNVSLTATGIASGTYESPTITVDTKGRITGILSGGGSRVLQDEYTDQTNSGSSPSGLYSLIIPGGTFITNGDKIEAKIAGQFNNAGNPKSLEVVLNTSGFSQGFTSNGNFSITITIIRSGASTIRAVVDRIYQTTVSSYVTEIGALNFANPIPIKLNATATITGDVVAKLATMSYKPAAL